MDFDSFFKSKTTSLLLAGILLLVIIVTARLVVQKYEVDKEIRQLQQQADEVNRKNQELKGLAKYLQTPEYAEQQAREKLNLKRDGEFVVGLPSDSAASGNTQSDSGQKSNFRLWLNYFFGNKI